MSEPTRGNYRAHPATDDYGEPSGEVDVRWHRPDGRLTWIFGVDAEFLNALEAKAATASELMAALEDGCGKCAGGAAVDALGRHLVGVDRYSLCQLTPLQRLALANARPAGVVPPANA